MNKGCESSVGSGDPHSGSLSADKGFSLIELLAVTAIILILFTLYWGSGSANRQKAACRQNLGRLFMAMQLYANDQDGRFPVTLGARTSGEALAVLGPRYTVDTSVFVCPAAKDPVPASADALRKRSMSYAYYMGLHTTNSQVLASDRQVDARDKSVGQPLFSSTGKAPGNNHGKSGGNLLFCDGHTESSPVIARVPLAAGDGIKLLNPE